MKEHAAATRPYIHVRPVSQVRPAVSHLTAWQFDVRANPFRWDDKRIRNRSETVSKWFRSAVEQAVDKSSHAQTSSEIHGKPCHTPPAVKGRMSDAGKGNWWRFADWQAVA